MYETYSPRSVSTLNANVKGLSLADVLKRGSWSNKST